MTTAPTLQERVALAIEPPQTFLVTYTPDGLACLSEADMKTLKGRYREREVLIRDLVARNAELEKRMAVATGALDWYADGQNYDFEGRPLRNASSPRWMPPLLDGGKTARDALVELSRSFPAEGES